MTTNPVFQAMDRLIGQSRIPNVKAPVDLLDLIEKYGQAKYVYGAQSVSDRYHQEYADAPDMGPITDEVERLQGCEYERDLLLDALRGVVRHFGAVEFCQDIPAFNAARAALRGITTGEQQ